MKHGKYICNTLKKIRLDIARANDIEYAPTECHHEGECAGTCPACESEMRYIEREIARKRSHGRAALIAGVSMGVMGLTATSCHSHRQVTEIDTSDLMGDVVVSERIDVPKPGQDQQPREEVFGRPPEPMPVFPGGDAALMKYIQEHIQYPPEAAKNKVQGKVIVQLQIDSEGKVSEVKVVQSVDQYLDEEAVRVCKSLPDFTPGSWGGNPVSTYYMIPVSFELEDDNKTESTDN